MFRVIPKVSGGGDLGHGDVNLDTLEIELAQTRADLRDPLWLPTLAAPTKRNETKVYRPD